MNIALIFAGGVGKRMNSKDRPKQFLLVHGKPIIVHTIELFEYHEQIDGIVVVCVKDWIPYMEEMKYRYRLDKIGKIVPGGETGQLSIYNGLCAAEELYGANATGEGVVCDGNVITAKGMGKTIDFALVLLEILTDRAMMDHVGSTIQYF